jgi:ethylmalonyl-CoA/methylmalonyl-CoA decarboxylase
MFIHYKHFIQNLRITKLRKIPYSPNMSFNAERRWVNHYAGPETPVITISEQFSKFEGGKIELVKDNESGLAILKINHPERRNALSGNLKLYLFSFNIQTVVFHVLYVGSMMVDLWNAVNALEDWKAGKGIILHSVGETFCSGGDLNTVRQISNPDDGYKMATLMHNTLTRLHQLPLISVALIQGKALGGGAELATSCDFRLFTEKGEIGFVQGRMGVVTGWGGGTRLVQLLGQHRALELLLTSRQISASEAVVMGLANGITKSVELPEAVEEAKQWLQSKLKHAPEIVHALKQIVATARAVPYEESLKNERQVFAMLWGGDANKKALEQNIKHK